LAQQPIQQYPGLETRYLFWGRRWDIIYYLLLDDRRQEHRHPDPGSHLNLVEKAIFGGEALHPDSQTTIGFRIRYLSSRNICEISSFLADSLRLTQARF
jgi:hypothetical protein